MKKLIIATLATLTLAGCGSNPKANPAANWITNPKAKCVVLSVATLGLAEAACMKAVKIEQQLQKEVNREQQKQDARK
jgi:hypothetical protein